ncbi:SRPBCC family protein [Curvivirga sp.]|uniref:SRPBCC family protein n=1 Tax=Curvivirga sp. TaxID=2856848 RepID=UPI003B5B1D82
MHRLAQESICLNAALPEVFKYVTDLNNFSEWFPEVQEFKETHSSPAGTIGKTYAEKVFLEGDTATEIIVEVVEYVEDEKIVTQAEFNPLLPRMEINFIPVNTTITEIIWNMDSRNEEEDFLRNTLPMMQSIISERANKGLTNLKIKFG